MKKIYVLLLTNGFILLLAFISYYLLKWLSGEIYSTSIIIVQGKTAIEKGNVYSFLYLNELIWYTIMLLLLSTIWILKKDDRKNYNSKIQYFLISKKMNVIVGVIFIFSALGLTFSKTIPDPIIDILTYFNLTIIALIIIRFILKEIYLRKRKQLGRP